MPKPLAVFLWAMLAYSAVSWISCGVHAAHHDPQAYSSPFIHNARDPFTDLRTYKSRFQFFHTEKFFEQSPDFRLPFFSYPAGGALVYWVFYHLPHNTLAYLGLAVAWTALLVLGLVRLLERTAGWRAWRAAAVALFVALTAFPLDFMVERGNVELVVWVFLFIGLWLWLRGHAEAAAGLFGVAAALKIFPVIFCGLLWRRRTWKAFVLSLAVAAGVTLFALWFTGPSIHAAFAGFSHTVNNYQHSYSAIARPADVGMDHSFFALVKVMGLAAGANISAWLPRYYAIAGMIALVLFFARAQRMPLVNRVLFFTVMMLGLPPNSFDYTLVYLYAPWLLLVLAAMAQARGTARGGAGFNRRMTLMLSCFVPLLAPFNLYVVHDVRFGGQVQAVLLIVLLVLGLCWPVDDRWMEAVPLPLRLEKLRDPEQ